MEQTSFKGKGVIKWALTIGIAIVLNLFFAVGIETVTPAPEYDDFCEQKQVQEVYDNETSCVEAGGQWNPDLSKPVPSGSTRTQAEAGYCNAHFTCGMEFQDATEQYAQNVFVALVVLGALAMLVGYFLRVSPAVSAGLSYGGVLTFVIASMRYWDAAGDLVRLAIVGLALVALIIVDVKKFKE